MALRCLVPLGLGALGVAAFASVAACSESGREVSSSPPRELPPTKTERTASGVKDAGAAVAAFDAAAEPSVYDGPLIGALFLQTPIMSDMEWPTKDDEPPSRKRERTAMRVGYLRQGAKVPVIDQPHVKSNCKDGWYELVQGGFVCGRYASLDLNHPKIKLAPHPPNLDGPLPYEYGYNVTNGTPLYRTIPSREERLRLEPWLSGRRPKPKPRAEEVVVQNEDLDAGAGLVLARVTYPAEPVEASDPLDGGVPWYLRDHDGGKPLVTLDELRGEGPMARRMVKGFFVALDKEDTVNNTKWWRTTGNLMAPHERILVHKTASQFQGIWLNDPPADAAADGDGGTGRKPIENLCRPGSKAQVAVVLFYKAKRYGLTESRKAVIAGDPLPRHSVVRLTGDSVLINGARYDETDEGFWIRRTDATRTDPSPPPRDLAPGEKWIDVNLKTQTLVAFEGDRPVYATAVSTGKEDKEDESRNHKTPTGTFRIREKHVAATMDGDGASDGPYSIEDVPWIMYYSGSFALHGAFWHNQFGREKSHGCTNLAPKDARAIFGWTEPRLPEGWHAVWSTEEKPGTRVVVHE